MSSDFEIFVTPPTEDEILLQEKSGKEGVGFSPVDKGRLPQDEPPEAVTGTVPVVPARNRPGYSEPLGIPRAVGEVKRGIYEPLAGIVDFFINAVPEALEYTGLAKDLPRDYVNRLVNAEDYEQIEEILGGLITYGAGRKGDTAGDDTTDRLLRSIGQGIGYTVPFYLTLARGAKLADELGELDMPPETIKEAVIKTIQKPYVADPTTTAKVEFGLGGVSGLGMGLEEEIFGTNTGLGGLLPLAPVGISYIAGGAVNKIRNFSPVAKAGKYAIEKGGTMMDDLSIKGGADPLAGKRAVAARSKLGEQIEKSLKDPETAATFARTKEIEEALLSSPSNVGRTEVPFTPAEATGDVPLVKTQKRIETEATADPDFVRKNIERKYDVLGTIENFKNDTVLGGKVDDIADAPLLIIDRVKGRFDSTIKKIDDTADEVADQLDILSSPNRGVLPKVTDRTTAGENIRGAVQKYYNDLVEETNKLALSLGIKDTTTMGSIAQAKQNIRDSILTKGGEEALSFEGLHPLVKKFMNYGKDEIDFQDWKNFTQQTSQQLSREIARGNGENIRVLKILKEELDNVLDQGQFGADIADSMRTFNNFYKQNLGAINDNSAIKKVISGTSLGKDKGVRYSMHGEAVADEFLKNSKTVNDYLRITKSDDIAVADLRSAMLDKMRDFSLKNDLIDSTKLNKFINNNREILKSIPGTKGGNLYDEFTLGKEGTANIITALNKRQNILITRKRKIEQNQLYKKISKIYEDANPTKLVDDALNNKGLMINLKSKLKLKKGSDEEATFNALIGSRIFKDLDTIIENPTKFKNKIINNEEIIVAGMGKEHYDNLRIIADGYETILRTGPIAPLAGDISPTGTMEAIAKRTGTSVPSIQARIIAVAEGRISKFTAGAYLASRLLSKNQSNRADAIFKEAMFDPKLAKSLAAGGTVKNGEVTFDNTYNPTYVRAYLFNIGLPFGQDLTQGEQQEIIFSPRSPEEKIKDTYTPPVREKPKPKPFVPITPELLEDSKVKTPPTPSSTAQTGIGTTDVASLFPNDATAMAIARRRAPSGGIATV